MARAIKQGQSIYIPFVNGESVFDSQNRPRMYKSVEQFQKSYPSFRLEKPELVEYAPVVRGRWIRVPSEIGTIDVETCSVCGCGMTERNQFWDAKWCPCCGARMDGENT